MKQFQVKVTVIPAEGLHNSLSYLHDSHISTDSNYLKNDEGPAESNISGHNLWRLVIRSCLKKVGVRPVTFLNWFDKWATLL